MPHPHVVIIGASSGMGHALARLCLSKGYSTAMLARRTAPMHALAAQYPDVPHAIAQLDVCQTATIPEVLQSTIAQVKGMDVLVHCAGYGWVNPQLDFAIEEGMIDTNIRGFTAVMDWVFHYFQQQGKGHLVVITSVAGLRGDRHAPAYFASKAYQISYLQALRHKAHKADLPIYITDIRPGFVDTKPMEGRRFWMCSAETAAAHIFKAIHQHKRVAYITPRWRWVALAMRIAPSWLYEKVM
ncbi:short-subunit dehydrogenase [Thermoflavifilum aggregans]|uniref:Short-subunit dehydrogenase n=1 Tax=Thermoflavifilum aggregans TaxID=454188 RepID=A0A2M9CVZ3_9BACT|nr:SDR family NAD(P)-dependent oxidoreductase [Thermoflavifilum aggregans]PJJ76073.1 short-subunit dehydrogenase [Thermoflavifilum aggregans]